MGYPVPSEGGGIMAQVFSSMGAAADRKINDFADSSRERFNQFKRKSLDEIVGDTSIWLKENSGKVLVGAVATALLAGYFLRRGKM
jgi:hypothetical protein